MNSLGAFKRVTLGAVTRFGTADISGYTTAEYRAKISLVKLYSTGLEKTPNLMSTIYQTVDQSPGSPEFSAPFTVWATSNGDLLQVQSSATRSDTVSSPPNKGPSSEVTTSARITLSSFGIAVHAVAPPARDVTVATVPPRTHAVGVVTVRNTAGRSFTEGGLLVMTIRLNRSASSSFSSTVGETELAGVDSKGHFDINFLSGPNTPDSKLQLHAVFYPGATTKLSCQNRTPKQFGDGTTTVVNFTC